MKINIKEPVKGRVNIQEGFGRLLDILPEEYAEKGRTFSFKDSVKRHNFYFDLDKKTQFINKSKRIGILDDEFETLIRMLIHGSDYIEICNKLNYHNLKVSKISEKEGQLLLRLEIYFAIVDMMEHVKNDDGKYIEGIKLKPLFHISNFNENHKFLKSKIFSDFTKDFKINKLSDLRDLLENNMNEMNVYLSSKKSSTRERISEIVKMFNKLFLLVGYDNLLPDVEVIKRVYSTKYSNNKVKEEISLDSEKIKEDIKENNKEVMTVEEVKEEVSSKLELILSNTYSSSQDVGNILKSIEILLKENSKYKVDIKIEQVK